MLAVGPDNTAANAGIGAGAADAVGAPLMKSKKARGSIGEASGGVTSNGALAPVPKKKKSKKEKDEVAKEAKPDPAEKLEREATEATRYLNDWLRCKQQEEEGETRTIEQGGAGTVWKFRKQTQGWLFRHIYNSELVSGSSFKIFCAYLEGLTGEGARSRLLAEAQDLMEEHEGALGDAEASDDEDVEGKSKKKKKKKDNDAKGNDGSQAQDKSRVIFHRASKVAEILA